MLSLSGTPIQLKNLKVTARHRLAGDDMSGQSAATEQAWKDYAIALRDYTSTDDSGNPVIVGKSRPVKPE